MGGLGFLTGHNQGIEWIQCILFGHNNSILCHIYLQHRSNSLGNPDLLDRGCQNHRWGKRFLLPSRACSLSASPLVTFPLVTLPLVMFPLVTLVMFPLVTSLHTWRSCNPHTPHLHNWRCHPSPRWWHTRPCHWGTCILYTRQTGDRHTWTGMCMVGSWCLYRKGWLPLIIRFGVGETLQCLSSFQTNDESGRLKETERGETRSRGKRW